MMSGTLSTSRPRRSMLIAALLGTAALAVSAGAQAQDASWSSYEVQPPIAPENIAVHSEYLTMPDGVKLAITTYVPADLEEGETLPALMRITRYLRAVNGQPVAEMIPMRRYLGNGYAYVAVDVRGTGASFGHWSVPRSPEEVADFDHILDWVAEQDWSNGEAGALGASYEGGTAEMAATLGNDTLKAVMPLFSGYDVHADVTSINGIRNSVFFRRWTDFYQAIDSGTYLFDVLPVDEESLAAARLDHRYNGDMYETVMRARYRDDYVLSDPAITGEDTSPHAFHDELQASQLPFYSLTGWYDSAFVQGSIKRYLNVTTPGSKLTIGPWKHGIVYDVTPREGNETSQFDLVAEHIRYFDEHLRGIDTGMADEAPVHYYTMVENAWKTADTWPPEAETLTLYAGNDSSLSNAVCAGAELDPYQVDYSTGTTLSSRWGMMAVNEMLLDDIHPAGSPVLSYTAPPLEEDTEVTGHPEINLYLASDQADGQFFVYLEDVAPDGTANYVTEGVLAGLHRAVSEAPYETPEVYHSQLRADAAPMPKGETVLLNFSMLPTSYLFKEGHSIRIVLTGADKDNFEPPATPPANWLVYRCSDYPTRIDLPVIR